MKQIGTKQFNSNDVMSLHQDMTAVKTLNETLHAGCVALFPTWYPLFDNK